jgi:hypothetical protein
MATLGSTVREFSSWERATTSRVSLREKTSRDRESTVRGFESRRFESSRVREFELDSGVIPTVKSERNKEREIEWLSLLSLNKYRHPGTI